MTKNFTLLFYKAIGLNKATTNPHSTVSDVWCLMISFGVIEEYPSVSSTTHIAYYQWIYLENGPVNVFTVQFQHII